MCSCENKGEFMKDLTGTTGVITLKAAPLHSGHIYAITQASTQVEHLYVVLSFDEKWIDNLDNSAYWKQHLSKKKRLLWLKRSFQDLDHITVLCIDETEMGAYPEGLVQWTTGVKELLLSKGVDSINTWFSSEPEYDWWIKQYFQCEHVIIDAARSAFNISATKIRENPYKYWEYLPSIVRREFLIKVVIIGTESSSKSTLTKYLAKMFNTSWVEETGRSYCLNEMCGDETLLDFNDYGVIASNRYYQELASYPTANKLLFVDTNAFVTQFYCELYEGKSNPLVDAYIEQEHYDLVLHLDDNVEWVDDGLRINSDRTKTSKLFYEMLDEYKIKEDNDYHFISGDYNQRLTSAIEIVKNKLECIKGETK